MYLGLHLHPFYGGRPAPRCARLLAGLALAAGLIGCGGGGEDAVDLTEGGELAARLPSDNALNIGIVDVDAVRESLGMGPGTAPPTDSGDDDISFLNLTGPALGIIDSGVVPREVVDAVLAEAHSAASVTGDRAATAISTTGEQGTFEDLLRSLGLREDDATFIAADGTFAVAIGDGVTAIADDPGTARSVVEETGGEVPEPLDQLDGDGQLITLARFGADCVDSVASTDSVGEEGEVAFFTAATPDPARVETPEAPPEEPRVVGDSARVKVPAATRPVDEPPALTALSNLSVTYDCAG